MSASWDTLVFNGTGTGQGSAGSLGWEQQGGPKPQRDTGASAPAVQGEQWQQQPAAATWPPSFLSGELGGAASGRDGPEPQLQALTALELRAALPFADEEGEGFRALPMQGFLMLRSQEEEAAARLSQVELPPLQSVLELTTAFRPPSRSFAVTTAVAEGTVAEAATAAAAAQLVGRQLPNGSGVLADGTTFTKTSFEEFGEYGFWKRGTILKGADATGKVMWEERWWEVSDWAGLKELGATKTGTSAAGGTWKETWCEKAYHNAQTLELTIERTAHKCARGDGESPDEWEEQWGEVHCALGSVRKWADKWGREGGNIWHEKWGEDYDGRGGCSKWTDKWAERLLPGGTREQWGDKWTEQFAHGTGTKHGEVWSVDGAGHRYQRWWNEHHMGERNVRKWGNSTCGEHWDTLEHMDTYYNPVPHFGFSHAVHHSPSLIKVPVRPRGVPQRDPPSRPGATPGNGGGSGAASAVGRDDGVAAPDVVGAEDASTLALGQGLAALDGAEASWAGSATPPSDTPRPQASSDAWRGPGASANTPAATPIARSDPSQQGDYAGSATLGPGSEVLKSVWAVFERRRAPPARDAEGPAQAGDPRQAGPGSPELSS